MNKIGILTTIKLSTCRLVREMDQKAAYLLELVLLDRASAQQAGFRTIGFRV